MPRRPRSAFCIAAVERSLGPPGGAHGNRRLYSHRQQRLAGVDDLAAIQTELRAQSTGDAQCGALRSRLRAVDDQAARIRREERILGPQPGILHPDGRIGRGDVTDQAVRHGTDLGGAAGDRRAHVLDDRFDLERAIWSKRDHRLATPGIFPDGPVAGGRLLRPPLSICCGVRPDPARALGNRAVGLQGRALHHERLSPEPAPAGRHEGHLRRHQRRGPRFHGAVCRLQFLLRQGHQHADRLLRHCRAHAGGRRPGPVGRSPPTACSW
jgi:hypothetical protein